jgi:hypothetical protein
MDWSQVQYTEERTCIYRDERYSVRDNGAVLRHARENKPPRKNDNFWTIGKVNQKGYLTIGNDVVHRIVAQAFWGHPPTSQHVVDHKDTNRQNNRPENLRWLTKLENILNNEITVKKIIYRCGSIEAFLENPAILRNHETADPNFSWMRAVTPEEAKISWERLQNWAKQKSTETKKSGTKIDEWIFKEQDNISMEDEQPSFIDSHTPMALQENYDLICTFPCCPDQITEDALSNYLSNLSVGSIFSFDTLASQIIIDYELRQGDHVLYVQTKQNGENCNNPHHLIQITILGDYFLHSKLGTYVDKMPKDKYSRIAQDILWK